MPESTLHWLDYLVLAIFLAISLGIGVYHSLTGGKQKTTNEFIMANRALSVIPTALSMLMSFISAIAVIGFTSEIYQYGVQYMLWGNLTYTIAIILAGLIVIPWIYPLKLVSTNEYFYRRFRSKLLAAVAGCMAVTGGILYMGVAMYAPSAALESVTGLPVVISIPLMAVVCVTYTSLGGMRAVIWTDVFQFVVMMAGIITIFVKGLIVIGGMEKVMTLLEQQDRVFWIILTPDPRVRHTCWEFLFGATAGWMYTYGFSQASVQRYSSTTSLTKARLSILLNFPPLVFMCCVLCVIGMIVTAYFISIQCDPVAAKLISSGNQLLPYFVAKLFSDNYGFSGLFLATLYGGALSSVSSSLSGGAANCLKDILKWKFDHIPEAKKALITRLLVVLFGAIAAGVAFLASVVPGPIIQIASSLNGSIAGPYLGLFLLGGLFRKANWKGSLMGVVCGLTMSIWLSMGSLLTKNKHPPLHPMPTSGCFPGNSTISSFLNSSDIIFSTTQDFTTQENLKYESPHGALQNFYSISYKWIIIVGLATTLIIGLLASFITGGDEEDEKNIDEKLFIPWKKIFSFTSDEQEIEAKVVDEKESPSVSLQEVYQPGK